MRTPAGTTIRSVRILGTLLSLATLNRPASACLRDDLDTRAVQWSTLIVRAKLTDRGKVTPLASNPSPDNPSTAPTTAPTTPTVAVAPEGLVVTTFEVTEALDGTASPGGKIRVLRPISAKAKSTTCSAVLSGKHEGDSFILLLRPLDQSQLAGTTPDAIPKHARGDAFVIVHAIAVTDADSGAVADLRQLIQDTRRAEAEATPDAIKAQVDAIANAADETEAEDAQKALLELGPRTLPALRAIIEGTSVKEMGRSRVKKMIEELAPPPMPPEKE
jgi:hypothetical protein